MFISSAIPTNIVFISSTILINVSFIVKSVNNGAQVESSSSRKFINFISCLLDKLVP